MDGFNLAGAGITIAMGCLGLFFPGRASALTGLTATTPEARGEFRGTLGITFILLGLAPAVTDSPAAYLAVGAAWAGAGLGRMVSIFLDDARTGKNWAAVGFELALGGLMISGAPFQALVQGLR
ncbi:DUF4345 family protein [Phenylobacterium sp.]|jgi:hypothetical protein|uniref:DUF4345 family protein n=1 Tax=Phenylobacterium sp. TaxID=1871053 RepID=UPI0037C93551